MLVPFASTTNFDIVYESMLVDQGVNVTALCQSILDHCEFDKLRLQILFGNIPINTPPGKIQVQVVPGSGGANEQGGYITLFCDATSDPSMLPALMVAEEAEIFMQYQQRGWIYDWSTGEALSRVCGPILYPASTNFGTGGAWLNSVSTGYNAANCAPCPPAQLPPTSLGYRPPAPEAWLTSTTRPQGEPHPFIAVTRSVSSDQKCPRVDQHFVPA